MQRDRQEPAELNGLIGARGGNRTRTLLAEKRILSPLRLPISPPGQGENPGASRAADSTDNSSSVRFRCPPECSECNRFGDSTGWARNPLQEKLSKGRPQAGRQAETACPTAALTHRLFR